MERREAGVVGAKRGGGWATGRVAGPMAAAVLALAVAAVGCARETQVNAGPAGHVGEAGPDTVAGLVREVGSTPFTRTLLEPGEGEEAVVAAGPYRAELRRLAGARVRATGLLGPAEDGPGRALEVSSYEVLEVDGERPWVGLLGEDEEGYLLETPDGREVRLRAVTLRLGAQVGGRVWVTLDENGGVARYGILRPPEEMEREA